LINILSLIIVFIELKINSFNLKSLFDSNGYHIGIQRKFNLEKLFILICSMLQFGRKQSCYIEIFFILKVHWFLKSRSRNCMLRPGKHRAGRVPRKNLDLPKRVDMFLTNEIAVQTRFLNRSQKSVGFHWPAQMEELVFSFNGVKASYLICADQWKTRNLL